MYTASGPYPAHGQRPAFYNYSDEDSLTFTLRSSATETTNLEMSTGLVRINTVLKTEVITSNTLKIGYLAFTSFLIDSRGRPNSDTTR